MANPIFIDITEGQWVKVATNVVSGMLRRVEKRALYLQTYRETGDIAPTLKSDGIPFFLNSIQEEISSQTLIDVYVWCSVYDGRIRVDL